MEKKLFWFGLFVIFLLGTGLRFWQLGHTPVSLYWDEQAILTDAMSVAQTGRDMHGRFWLQPIYPSYGDYKLGLYIWFASGAVKLLGPSYWAVRLPSALAGVLTMVVAALIAQELSLRFLVFWSARQRHWLVWAAAAMVGIAPWSLVFSHSGFEGHMGQMVLGFSVWCLMRGWRRHTWWPLLLGGALGGLAVYGYFSVLVVWPVVWMLTALMYLRPTSWHQFRRNSQRIGLWLAKLFASGLVFGLVALPLLRTDVYRDMNARRLGAESILTKDYALQSNILRERAGNTRWSRVIFHRHLLMGIELAKNYADHLSLSYLFFAGDQNLRHSTQVHGEFLAPLILMFGIGWIMLLRRDWRVGIWLLAWWLIALLPACVPETTPHALRSLNALIPLALVLAVGCVEFVAWGMAANGQQIRLWRRLVLGTYGLVCVLALAQFLTYYAGAYRVLSYGDWMGGFDRLATAIYAHRQGDQPVLVRRFDDRFYLWLITAKPYDFHQVQKWPSHEYQFSQFDSISFEPSATTAPIGALVAGEYQPILDEERTICARFDIMATITNLRGQPQFLVGTCREALPSSSVTLPVSSPSLLLPLLTSTVKPPAKSR